MIWYGQPHADEPLRREGLNTNTIIHTVHTTCIHILATWAITYAHLHVYIMYI